MKSNNSRTYDFSGLFSIEQSIKQSFRKLKLQKLKMQKQQIQYHNRFYQKLMCGKMTKEAKKRKEMELAGVVYLEKDQEYNHNSHSYNNKSTLSSPQKSPLNQGRSPSHSPLKGEMESEPDQDEVSYLIENKYQFLDPVETDQFCNENELDDDQILINQLFDKNNDLSNLKINEFRKCFQKQRIVDECAQRLFDIHFSRQTENSQKIIEDIRSTLPNVDKYLFIQFRNKEFTFPQLRARVTEKLQKIKYTVLDDLKKDLNPEFVKGMDDELFFKLYKSEKKGGRKVVPVEEFQKPTQPWQSNLRCLNSLYPNEKQIRYQKLQLKNKKVEKDDQRRIQKFKKEELGVEDEETLRKRRKELEETIKRENEAQKRKLQNQGHEKRKTVKLTREQQKLELRKQLKEELQHQVDLQNKRYFSNAHRLSWSNLKDEEEQNNLLLSQKMPQPPSFKSKTRSKMNSNYGTSLAVKRIQDSLQQEQSRIENLIFLKQLEEDGQQVMWEPETKGFLLQREAKKRAFEENEFKRDINQKKPRPREFLKSAQPGKRNNRSLLQTAQSQSYKKDEGRDSTVEQIYPMSDVKEKKKIELRQTEQLKSQVGSQIMSSVQTARYVNKEEIGFDSKYTLKDNRTFDSSNYIEISNQKLTRLHSAHQNTENSNFMSQNSFNNKIRHQDKHFSSKGSTQIKSQDSAKVKQARYKSAKPNIRIQRNNYCQQTTIQESETSNKNNKNNRLVITSRLFSFIQDNEIPLTRNVTTADGKNRALFSDQNLHGSFNRDVQSFSSIVQASSKYPLNMDYKTQSIFKRLQNQKYAQAMEHEMDQGIQTVMQKQSSAIPVKNFQMTINNFNC